MQPLVLDVAPGALADYYEWFRSAKPGAVLVYWTGDLAYDRDLGNFDDTSDEGVRQRVKALDALASRIASDASDGYLHLLQKRIALSVYEYRAVRRQTVAEASKQLMFGGKGSDRGELQPA